MLKIKSLWTLKNGKEIYNVHVFLNNIMKKIKRIILLILALSGYLVVSIWIWWWSIPLWWVVFSSYILVILGAALLAVFWTLLSVLWNVYPIRNLQFVIALLLFAQLAIAYAIFGTSSEWFFVMMMTIVFHLGMYSFFWTKRMYFDNRLRTNPWAMSTIWIGTFGSVIWVTVSIMLWMQLLNAEVKCEKIYDSIETLVLSPIQPISYAARWVSEKWKQPMDSVMDFDEEETFSWSLSLVSWYDVAKAKVVDEIADDKEKVRSSMCEIIASNVEEKVQHWLGFIPTMVLLFLIVSPLVSIAFRILSIVIWIVIQLLIVTRVFNWKKRVRHTKELG